MSSQSQFCITAALNQVSDPNRDLVQDHRVAEKHNRVRQLASARQRIVQIEAIVADFDRMAIELEGWIRVEENRTRIHDSAHFAYSASAVAMTRRRDVLRQSRETLMRTVDELKRQLSEADAMLE
jgi:hypothetical protein